MSFLDALTGDAYKKANRNNMQAIATGLSQGGTALQDTSKAALNYLFGNGPDQPGAMQVTQRGYDQSRGDLGAQYAATQSFLGEATDAYRPMAQAGLGALGTYFDAIGGNGAEGSARAASAFQASPAYNYSMDQALGAVQRSAAARGGLAGGNATSDILRTANGLASQGFQSYIDNLKGGVGVYGQGVQGQASGLTTQGGASQSYGNALSALGTGQGNALAGIYGQGAGIQTGLGVNSANLISGMTGRMIDSNNALAAGQTKASENALGTLVGLGKSALDFNPFKGL